MAHMILYFKVAILVTCGVQRKIVVDSTECGIGERLWFLISGGPEWRFWLRNTLVM